VVDRQDVTPTALEEPRDVWESFVEIGTIDGNTDPNRDNGALANDRAAFPSFRLHLSTQQAVENITQGWNFYDMKKYFDDPTRYNVTAMVMGHGSPGVICMGTGNIEGDAYH
jgi:hypothetical protein